MKIFSEKFNFKIEMDSTYCPHIDRSEGGSCPGVISRCSACGRVEDCHASSGTCFTLHFQKVERPVKD
jgi:hypothetical protein